jgi:hypothetical protein
MRGGLAQLVARLNGIEKVSGSNPLTSTILYNRCFRLSNQRVYCTHSIGFRLSTKCSKVVNLRAFFAHVVVVYHTKTTHFE